MKQLRFIAGTTLVLFLVGFISGSLVLKLTEKLLAKQIIGLSIWSSFFPQLSFGLLLAFCSVCAGCFFWVFSKVNSVSASKPVFGLGLLISILSASISIGWKLLQIRATLNSLGNVLNNSVLPSENINYFSWGFGLTFFITAVGIGMLWLVSHQGRQKSNSSLPTSNN